MPDLSPLTIDFALRGTNRSFSYPNCALSPAIERQRVHNSIEYTALALRFERNTLEHYGSVLSRGR